MNKAVLLLLAVVAIAAAAFFTLQTGDAAGDQGADLGVQRSDTEDRSPAEGGGPEDLLTPDAVTSSGDRSAAEAAARPSVAAPDRSESTAVATASTPQLKGVLEGRATDANGLPVPGASVKLARRDINDILVSGDDGGFTIAGAPEATAGEDGRFSIESRPGNVRVEIEADGFAPYSASAAIPAGETEDIGDVRLAPGVTLSGRVVDSRGDGVSGAKIQRAPEENGGITLLGQDPAIVATTGPGGEFEILRQGVGPYRFYVTHGAHPTEELSGSTEQVGQNVSGLEVVLDAGATIRGVAVGIPEGAGPLVAYALPGDEASTRFSFSTGPERSREAPVAADGSFELTGLVGGAPYRIQLGQGSRRAFGRNRRSVSVSALAPVEGLGPIVQVPFSRGATVSFTVLDSEGTPHLPDRIEAGFDYTRIWDNAVQNATTGSCVLNGIWPAQGGEALMLELHAKGFDTWKAKDLIVHPNAQVDLGEIRLVARPSVRVTVVDDLTGHPIEGASVRMQAPKEVGSSGSFRFRASLGDSDEDEAPMPSFDEDAQFGKTDAEGICSLDATAGATVVIKVDDGEHAPAELGPITLPEKMTVFEQEARLAPGGALRVVALDPSGTPAQGYAVDFRGEDYEDAGLRGGRTGDDGVLIIGGLPPGEHFLRLGKAGPGLMFGGPMMGPGTPEPEDEDTWTKAVVLPGETVDVALEAPAIGTLTGTVTELGAALGGARVELRSTTDNDPMAGMMMFGGSGYPTGTSDARGEFRITGIEAGEYEIFIEHPTRAMADIQPITIEGGDQSLEVDLTVTEVVGRVTDEAGEPIVGARVEAARAPVPGGSGRSVMRVMMVVTGDDEQSGVMMSSGDQEGEPSLTDEEGRYRLRGVEAGVDLEVSATAKGYDEAKSEPFRVSEGSEETGVDVIFETPGSIKIEVEGLTGRVLATLRRRGEEGAQPKMQMLTGPETIVDSLAPGVWVVQLQSATGDEIVVTPEDQVVGVLAGETVTASFEIE